MISPEKLNSALFALQALIIKAREMASQQENYAKIADILDYTEELPRLIASKEDNTNLFRDILVEIAEKHNSFYALQKFDLHPVPEKW